MGCEPIRRAVATAAESARDQCLHARVGPLPGVKASPTIGLAYAIAGLGDAAGPLIGGMLTDSVGIGLFTLTFGVTGVTLTALVTTRGGMAIVLGMLERGSQRRPTVSARSR